MNDSVRQRMVRVQGSDQQIVVLSICRVDCKRARINALKAFASFHTDNLLRGGLQPSVQDRCKTGVISKDEPGSNFLRVQSRLIKPGGFRQNTFPGWHVEP